MILVVIVILKKNSLKLSFYFLPLIACVILFYVYTGIGISFSKEGRNSTLTITIGIGRGMVETGDSVIKASENVLEMNDSSDEARRESRAIEYKDEASGGGEDTDLNNEDNNCLWQWKNQQGNWVYYPKSENDKIQKAHEKNSRGTILVRVNGDL